MNATNFQGGQINLTYNSSCVNITALVNDTEFPLWYWNSKTDGEEWILFAANNTSSIPIPLTGNYRVGTLTIKGLCEVEDCTTPLDFIGGSILFNDTGAEIPVSWVNGTFTCTASDTTPPVPTGLQNTTGDDWVNYTWIAGGGIGTDGYNVTMNDTWYNTTDTFLNSTVGAGNWSNITVWAWNATGDGNMSDTSVSDNVQATAATTTLQYINVAPTSQTLNITESVDFNATGYDDNGDQIDPPDLTFAWYTTPSGIGTLNATGPVVNFTALHAGRTEIYAVNDSVSSNETYKVWITVNAPAETKNVTNGTGNTTSGNSTAIVNLNNASVNGTITIKELGDPLNETENIENRTGLGTEFGLIKGVNVTINASIVAALNDTGGYVHIRVKYNESQLGNIDENTLYMYKFVNGTGWVKLVQGDPSYCIANGRDMIEDYIWVNVTEFSTFLLAGTPTVTPTSPHSGGSGGSGGGGGSASSGEAFGNIVVREKYYDHIYKDRITHYNFTATENPIATVAITGNINAGEILVMVEALNSTSTLVSEPPDGLVYRNVNIWVGTSGFATPKNIKKATIKFKVENEWLKYNKIDLNNIILQYYANKTWKQVETRKIVEEEDYTLYKSTTDHFSPFAITAIPISRMMQGPAGQNGMGAIPIKPTTTEGPRATPATEENKTPGFTIEILITTILGAYAVRRILI